MAHVTLRLFGTPQLCVEDGQLDLGRRKAIALLAYLAVTGSRHPREALAALLWPESRPEAAYSALRNVLWILRQTPIGRWIRADRRAVALVAEDGLEVDVRRFRDGTGACAFGKHARTKLCPDCVEATADAVSSVRGPFLEGFLISAAERFDDWQFAEREALQREFTEALDRLSAFYVERGQWAAAAAYAQRWMDVDRLSEPACRRLMENLSSLGRRSDALRCYAACARALDAELGVSPEPATAELANRLRRQVPARARPPKGGSRGNLPAPWAPVVGRDALVARVAALLRGNGGRLVTLVGLGGIGKTTLALQIGRQLERTIRDGVFVVPLGSGGDREAVASAIADVLGLEHARDRGARPMLEIEDYMREREMLLILDEAEQAAGTGEAVASLLAAAPRLGCLVTSHVPLNLRGETIVAVHGLAAPEEDSPAASVGGYESIRMLRLAGRRAEGAAGDGEDDLAAMARVARLLEGFPLGLEMAAAWRGLLSWEGIADRIAANLDFLVHTHGDVPVRHRSLRAVYEQACALLNVEERAALRRLALFQGGFAIEAAERVADGSAVALASLAKRCLIRRVAPDRYQVHELIRQFSLEDLRRMRGESAAAAGRHTAYFLELVARAFSELKGPNQIATLRDLKQDLPNLRAAWLRAAGDGDVERLRRAAHGMFFYYDMRAQFEEGKRVFREALEALETGKDAVLEGFLRVACGWFAQFSGEGDAEGLIDDGIRILDDEPFRGADHALAIVIAQYAGRFADLAEVRTRLGKSLALYRREKDRWGEALALDALALAEFGEDPKTGERLAAESLRLRRAIGDRWGEALALATLGRFAESEGEWQVARLRYHQSQQLAERIAKDLYMAIEARLARARIAGRLGEIAEGERLAEEGWMHARAAGNRLLTAEALIELGRLARERGDGAAAAARWEEAFALLEHGTWRGRAACAELLCELAQASGDVERAERWREEATLLAANEGEKK